MVNLICLFFFLFFASETLFLVGFRCVSTAKLGSPLCVLEHGILESELGKRERRYGFRSFLCFALGRPEKSHFLWVIIFSRVLWQSWRRLSLCAILTSISVMPIKRMTLWDNMGLYVQGQRLESGKLPQVTFLRPVRSSDYSSSEIWLVLLRR